MMIGEIRGIGEKTEALFHKVGVYTDEDLLRYYPVHYKEYKDPVSVDSTLPGMICAVEGIVSGRPFLRNTGRVKVVTCDVRDESGLIHMIWFNAPYIASKVKPGCRFVFYGKISFRGMSRYMEHPEIFTCAEYDTRKKTFLPVYSLTRGLSNAAVLRAVRQVLDKCGIEPDYLPDSLRNYYGLMPYADAVHEIHFPENEEMLLKARKRLVFDEFFLFIFAMRMLKESYKDDRNGYPMKETWDTETLIEKLPYDLTGAQKRAWHTIEADLCGDKLMNRLVQGDVGSGKTILAFLAMQMTASNGLQSAMMAPTEVLARQHYQKLCGMCEEMNLPHIKPILLTGSLTEKQKREARKKIEEGDVNCIIGTQALIQEKVNYKNLALVITDEQHRFGVRQRKALTKGEVVPNLMVMSATPIPRTLGIIYFGDLDITILDEKPKMQRPIKNAVVDRAWRPNAYRFIKKQVESGRQAYIICPMVEQSEEIDAENVKDYTVKMKKEFPDFQVAMLHGRMKNKEKDKIMQSFADGEIQILVSTTVVEVGVDVPNAAVIMIEDAERFGLAELHQIRGRVGRGEFESYCIFMSGSDTEEAKERLDILGHSNDGFYIAEKDFELRGPGDLLGIRQSGDLYFTLADVTRDGDILKAAGEAASAVSADDPELITPLYASLKKKLDQYLKHTEASIIL